MKKWKEFMIHALNYIWTVCKISVAFLVAAWLVGFALELLCQFVTIGTFILLMAAGEVWLVRQYRNAKQREEAAKHE